MVAKLTVLLRTDNDRDRYADAVDNRGSSGVIGVFLVSAPYKGCERVGDHRVRRRCRGGGGNSSYDDKDSDDDNTSDNSV